MWRDRGDRIHVSADEARGGEIVLRTPARRAIFLGGLIGAMIVGLAAVLAP
jgi:hypothetical protein